MKKDNAEEKKNDSKNASVGQDMTLSEAIRKMPDLKDDDLWETLGEMRIE